jgi:L-ribulose-5-phosphate 3-epimerase
VLPSPPIGVIADHFRLPVREAVALAARLGFEMIELAAAEDLDPRTLSETGRHDLGRYVAGQGLTLGALGCPVDASAWSSRRIEQTLQQVHRILDMARQLRVPVVTTELPCLPGDPRQWQHDSTVQAVADLAAHADKLDVTLALSSPATPTDRLAEMLRRLACPRLQAMLDPGSMLMLGQNPIAAVPHVAGRLALTHLRDAAPSLGKGQLDVPAFLEMLAQTGPPRPLMLARSGAENPVDDLRAARKLIADLQRTAH